ncbi:unnamed protein product [Paramecium sonneborni]|uniref:Protein kinase domain-containing protein n=1 Tax=Paramecium sonneborni TaxID=65129 RepID=A0A8S1QMA8_9CILI|nr:unnamed protein product [Paramecium sonneborni]
MNDQNDYLKDIHANLKSIKCIQGSNIFYKYQIKELLGNGQNRVYLGYDNFGRQVAIKEHHDTNAMRKEVQLLEQLNHPNIIQYLDSCILLHSNNQYHKEQNGYICMELGKLDLDTYKKKKYPIGKELIDQTLSALAYLQRNKIAHCDIKPANILVMQTEPIVYKICDVASSKSQGSEFLQAGTYKYMSPEMLNNNAKNYILSDVFSLGLLFLYVFRDFSMPWIERKNLTDLEFIEQLRDKIDENDDDIQRLLNYMIQLNPLDRLDFIQLEEFWHQQKKKEEKQEFNYTQIRQFRAQSNFFSIQEDQYYATGKFIKQSQNSKLKSSRKQLLQPFQSISPQKKSLLLQKSSNTTLKSKKFQQQILPLDNYFQKLPKSPEKSKMTSPTKTIFMGKIQLPQLKEERTNSFKIRPIQF